MLSCSFKLAAQRLFAKKIINTNEEIYRNGKKFTEIDFETAEAIYEVGISLGRKKDQLHKLAEIAAERGKRLDVIYGTRTSAPRLKEKRNSLRFKFGNRVRFFPMDF